MAVGVELEQQEAVLHKEDAHGADRHQRQQYPGDMRLNPVHGEHRLMRLTSAFTQPRLVADVVNRVEGGGGENGVQQELYRHHGHVKLEHQ